jgi:hypothetical protein
MVHCKPASCSVHPPKCLVLCARLPCPGWHDSCRLSEGGMSCAGICILLVLRARQHDMLHAPCARLTCPALVLPVSLSSCRPAGAKIRHRQVPLVLSCLHFLCRPPPCKHNITPLKSYGSAAAQLHRVERKPLSTPHKPCSTSIGAFAKLSSLSTSVNFSQDFTTPTSTQRRFVSFSSSHSTFVGKRVVQHPMHSSQVSKPMSAKQHLRSAQLVP